MTKTEEYLANLIADRIEPRLVPEVHVIPWRKTYVLAVDVFPSSSRPHYVKAVGFPGGVYIRIGSTNRPADAAAVAELQRVVRGRSFVGAFKSIWRDSWGPRLEYILHNALVALLDCPNTTLLGMVKLFIDSDYRRWVVNQVRDPLGKDPAAGQ